MSNLRIVAIADGKANEVELASRRLQLSGEVLIVGTKDGVSDTLARIFDMVAELRIEVESTD